MMRAGHGSLAAPGLCFRQLAASNLCGVSFSPSNSLVEIQFTFHTTHWVCFFFLFWLWSCGFSPGAGSGGSSLVVENGLQGTCFQ